MNCLNLEFGRAVCVVAGLQCKLDIASVPRIWSTKLHGMRFNAELFSLELRPHFSVVVPNEFRETGGTLRFSSSMGGSFVTKMNEGEAVVCGLHGLDLLRKFHVLV